MLLPGAALAPQPITVVNQANTTAPARGLIQYMDQTPGRPLYLATQPYLAGQLRYAVVENDIAPDASGRAWPFGQRSVDVDISDGIEPLIGDRIGTIPYSWLAQRNPLGRAYVEAIERISGDVATVLVRLTQDRGGWFYGTDAAEFAGPFCTIMFSDEFTGAQPSPGVVAVGDATYTDIIFPSPVCIVVGGVAYAATKLQACATAALSQTNWVLTCTGECSDQGDGILWIGESPHVPGGYTVTEATDATVEPTEAPEACRECDPAIPDTLYVTFSGLSGDLSVYNGETAVSWTSGCLWQAAGAEPGVYVQYTDSPILHESKVYDADYWFIVVGTPHVTIAFKSQSAVCPTFNLSGVVDHSDCAAAVIGTSCYDSNSATATVSTS